MFIRNVDTDVSWTTTCFVSIYRLLTPCSIAHCDESEQLRLKLQSHPCDACFNTFLRTKATKVSEVPADRREARSLGRV